MTSGEAGDWFDNDDLCPDKDSDGPEDEGMLELKLYGVT